MTASDQLPSLSRTHDIENYWSRHYDAWFQLDHDILKTIIAEGETSVYRALNRYSRIVNSKGKDVQFDKDWNSTAFNRPEPDYSNAPHLLPTGRPVYVVSRVLDREVPVPFYTDTSTYPTRYLMDVIAELKPQAVVELGSGDGARLFELDLLGIDRSIHLYGAERSQHGRAITQTLCSLDPDINITTHPFDFGNPDYSFIQEHDNILVFTNMTLMFLRDVQEDFILDLGRVAKSVTCIHFEPFGHQFSTPQLPVSESQQQHFVKRSWNMTFVAVLDRLKREGKIHELSLYKDILMTRDPNTPVCILSWKNH